MNLGHIKYAVEVANTGSFSRASEKLFISQPNLSRAIRELESSLGITIFERSSKGAELTADGEVFIRYAKNILNQINDVENMFSEPHFKKSHFSVSAPRASYAAEAFAKFSSSLADFSGGIEAFYRETDSRTTIDSVFQDEYKLGMIRYAATYDKHFKSMLDEKKLSYELIAEFHYILLISEKSPLANMAEITYSDLVPLTEISYSDPYLPSLPLTAIEKDENSQERNRRIYVVERASQFEILSHNISSFMWSSPIPHSLLKRYGLVQREVSAHGGTYKDVLIHKSVYNLTAFDKMFIVELCEAKREAFKILEK